MARYSSLSRAPWNPLWRWNLHYPVWPSPPKAKRKKQQGDNRTIDPKHTVPLWCVCGPRLSSFLAKQTGFGEDDLELVLQALALEYDRSAARGEMSTRGLLYSLMTANPRQRPGPRAV